MDAADTRKEARRTTQCARRAPLEAVRINATYDNGGDLGDEVHAGPIELCIEATNADGQIADFFDDAWWLEVIERWADEQVTVKMLHTPAALLHPITLHHMEMVARVAPRWRLVGRAYVSDVTTDEDIVALAQSPYHEVRFIDQPRPGPAGSKRSIGTLPIAELIGRIRREQERMNASHPILVRLPAPIVRPESATELPDPQRTAALPNQ
jgi:hypothetical protein